MNSNYYLLFLEAETKRKHIKINFNIESKTNLLFMITTLSGLNLNNVHCTVS